jgi:hypothetical protein
MTHKISIPHVAWRNGRPRFEPSVTLRKAGHKGHDLKTAAGAWMSEGEAIDWSRAFVQNLEVTRGKATKKKIRQKKDRQAAVKAAMPPVRIIRSFTLGQMLETFVTVGSVELGHAESTRQKYRSYLRAIEDSAPDFWFTEAAALRRREIRIMHRLICEHRTESMAHMAIVVTSSAYNWTIDNDDDGELIPGGNPVVRIKTRRAGKRGRVIRLAEFLHLVATAEAQDERAVADMLVWGLWTAQRASDRLSMFFAHLVDDRIELTQQKTKSFVSIPLSPDILERLPARGTNRAHVIAIDYDEAQQRQSAYYYRFHKVIEKAAETMPSVEDILDRDLRRTAISWMGRAGCTITEIFSISGHKFKGETAIMGHYMAIDPSIADNAIAKLQRFYDAELVKLESKERKSA